SALTFSKAFAAAAVFAALPAWFVTCLGIIFCAAALGSLTALLTASLSAGISAADATPANRKLAASAAVMSFLDFLSMGASSLLFENLLPFRVHRLNFILNANLATDTATIKIIK